MLLSTVLHIAVRQQTSLVQLCAHLPWRSDQWYKIFRPEHSQKKISGQKFSQISGQISGHM